MFCYQVYSSCLLKNFKKNVNIDEKPVNLPIFLHIFYRPTPWKCNLNIFYVTKLQWNA